MSTPPDSLPDLPESARIETRADLLAGSAGYQHFLQQLSSFISPEEARASHSRFRRASRAFWIALLSFLLLYVGVNQLLGPHGLGWSALGNDALRALLLLAAIILSGRLRIAVAGQMLLPLAALCFLPMPTTAEENWWQSPRLFVTVVLLLFLIGWCLDAGSEQGRQRYAALASRILPRVGIALFCILNLIAWKWILDGAIFPFFSLAAAALGLLLIELDREIILLNNDIEFLYAAAWKRWRFLTTGRALAVILGIIPFLLFSNLLDYQEELERCVHIHEAPDILRIDSKYEKWDAFFWREEGRFLTEADLKPAPQENPAGEASESHPGPEAEKNPVIHAFYLLNPTFPTASDSDELPPEFRGPDHAIPSLDGLDISALKDEMLSLHRLPMTRDEFDDHLKKFEPLRLTSRERLLRRTTDPISLISRGDVVIISYYPTPNSGTAGRCFVEMPQLKMRGPEEIERLIHRYAIPKWIFFCIGILGFIFLWRRGGDSSLARWLGIWLVGINLIPTLTASDDTLPHLTHWLWQQSVLYHWNTLASIAQPIFSLFYLAATSAAILWMTQIAPALCWVYICWPTKIYPQFPAVVRHLIIIGKLSIALAANFFVFCITVFPVMIFHGSNFLQFSLFLSVATVVFLVSGAIVRNFTGRNSEVPRLGFWPVLAVIALNLTIMFYGPSLMFSNDDAPFTPADFVYFHLAAFCGCLFIAILSFMILKRDFLRVRAIPGFTMLLLLILVPWSVHALEETIPHILTSSPFFRERGAEMVSLMLLVLVFPKLHELLHEFLLAISTPKLRFIEHRVEHALEEIVDAEDDHARAHMVSELFEKLRVPRYLFLSRRSKGLFLTDINKLGPASGTIPPSLEFSEQLREFLGRHHHFIDLRSMAYEWPFFFHQFELFRLTQTTDCRFLLPIAVGESVRGLLLLPETPGSTVVSNPAVSPNINNLGIAATLFRPKQ